MKKEIKGMLERLNFVKWDRFVRTPDSGESHFYGWIDRQDSRKDFVVLSYTAYPNAPGYWWFITSSADRSKDIAMIVDGNLDDHNPCMRVEDEFDIENVIKLFKS